MNLDYTVWEVMRDVREKESDGTTGKTVSNDWRKNWVQKGSFIGKMNLHSQVKDSCIKTDDTIA